MNNSTNQFDQNLILLLKNKDEKALSTVYDMYAPYIYGVVVNRVKDEKVAAQILQNTFTRIWNECDTLDCIKSRLVTWLIGLTYKTALTDFNIKLPLPSFSVKLPEGLRNTTNLAPEIYN